jgi:hypothetical protein
MLIAEKVLMKKMGQDASRSGKESGQAHNFCHILLDLAQVDAASIRKMKDILISAFPFSRSRVRLN